MCEHSTITSDVDTCTQPSPDEYPPDDDDADDDSHVSDTSRDPMSVHHHNVGIHS